MSRIDALMSKLRKREQPAQPRLPGYDPFNTSGLEGGGFPAESFTNGFGNGAGYHDPFAFGMGDAAYDPYAFPHDDGGTATHDNLSSFAPVSASPPSSVVSGSRVRDRDQRSSPVPFKFEDFYIDDKASQSAAASDVREDAQSARSVRFLDSAAMTVVSDMQGAFPRATPENGSRPSLPHLNGTNKPVAASSITNIPETQHPTVPALLPYTGDLDDTTLSKFRNPPKDNRQAQATNYTKNTPSLPSTSKPAPPPASHPSSDEFGDGDDDSWLQNALVEANKVEAATLPPPGPSTSPFFSNSKKSTSASTSTLPLRPKQTAPDRPSSRLQPQPPSRPASTSSVSFPKHAGRGTNSPLAHTPPNARFPAQPQATPSPALPSLVEPKLSDDRVPVMALDTPMERSIFPFTHFNAMQSAIFQAAYNSDQNLVVSAPTGSGKTTVFELALLKMLKNENGHHNPLAIYMAPTKALVNERRNDWQFRLGKMSGFKCLEVTGDVEMKTIKDQLSTVDLIVTTPEKWDSITRRGSTELDRLQLMMIDEVHILQEDRGPTLEVVVARMKAKGSRIRFVAVSASVPNMEDVARWIGPRDYEFTKDPTTGQSRRKTAADYDDIEEMPQATIFKFGEEFRPVPLAKHVMGTDAYNDFVLGPKLDKELFPVLNMYSAQKPVLIFVPTRKGCSQTAEQLCKDYQTALDLRRRVPWVHDASLNFRLLDKKVEDYAKYGISIHHAGLDASDRRNIEDGFKNGRILCLVATSTLAVGVNLPAHLVVIKGTSMWQGGGTFRDYTDVDIQQMMGRAGRPQYDNSGTVVIMCNSSKKLHYENMLSGSTLLESCLHQHLTEHINSEIGLGTIVDLESGKKWLHGTFLAIRIKQNPRPYTKALSKDDAQSWKEALDHYVQKALKDLAEDGLVQHKDLDDIDHPGEANQLTPTIYGKIMSQNFISYPTMKRILGMPEDASISDLLMILCGAVEFSSMRLRQGEGGILNKLREHPHIRYHLNEPVKTYADKVFLHLQVTFGNVSLEQFTNKSENASPLQTQFMIFNTAPRIAKSIFLVAVEKRYGGATRSALELIHTIAGKAWEDSASVFRQIPNIGPKSLTVLATNGMTSFEEFVKMDTGRLEMWFNRAPGFGQKVIDWAKLFPRFQLEFTEMGISPKVEGEYPSLTLGIKISWTGSLKQLDNSLFKNFAPGTTPAAAHNMKGKWHALTILFITSTNRFLEVRSSMAWNLLNKGKGQTVLTTSSVLDPLTVTLEHPDEKIIAIIGVDERAGVCNTFEYKPNIEPSHFPEKPKEVPKEVPKRKEPDSLDLFLSNGSKDKSTDKTKEAAKKSKEPSKSKEPLFIPHDDSEAESVYELEDEDEVIDLTVERRKKGAGNKKRGDAGKKTSAAVFIDDEAELSGDDEPMDVDDTLSINSLDEFDQFFIDDAPPPRKSKSTSETSRKTKRKSLEPEPSSSKRQREAPKWATRPPSPSPSPVIALTTPPPSGSTSSRANGITASNSARSKPRHPVFNRTPSADKPTPMDSTLAPDRSSYPSNRSSVPSVGGRGIFKSPSPELLSFSVDGPMDEPAPPSPPSGQTDDFDSWVNELLEM